MRSKAPRIIIVILAVCLCRGAWLFTSGRLRVAVFTLFIPFWYGAFLAWVNCSGLKCGQMPLAVLANASFLLCGLMTHGAAVGLMWAAALLLLAVHITAVILTVILSCKEKKSEVKK